MENIIPLASYIFNLAGWVFFFFSPKTRRALPAVFKYLIMGTIGANGFYLIGVWTYLHDDRHAFNLADYGSTHRRLTVFKSISLRAGFITIGLALKAAVFLCMSGCQTPIHMRRTWLTVFLAACCDQGGTLCTDRFD